MNEISEERIIEEFCALAVALGSTAGAAYVGKQPKVHDLVYMLEEAVRGALTNVGVAEAGLEEVRKAFEQGYRLGVERQLLDQVPSDDARA